MNEMAEKNERLDISVVVPVYNESESIPRLVDRLLPVLEKEGSYEVIFIDDGSDDGTDRALDEFAGKHPDVIKIIGLRTNCGKSVALQAGFNESSGNIIVMMDGDLQDRPEEIPKLLDAIREKGYDAVTGWKKNRQDPISKTFPSQYFNKMTSALAGLELHDFNCGLKAFRRECLGCFTLYGQLHRFILIFINHHGYKVGEVAVEHDPRLFGKSKYGTMRIYYGMMDLLTVFFITRYLDSPLYFFGVYGVGLAALSFPIGVYFITLHVLYFFNGIPEYHLSEHPLWIVSPILLLTGLIMIFFGLIGELLTYHHKSIRGNPYISYVKKKIGFPADDTKNI